MKSLLRALERHWFAPASTRDLAVVRIVLVSAQLLLFLPSLGPQLEQAAADPSTYIPLPALKVLLLPFGWGARPDPMFLNAVWLLAIISGIAAIVGLYTRLSLLCFAASNMLLVAHGYSYQEFHHPEALMIIALWVLALAPSGSAYAVDDLRARVGASTRFLRFQPRGPEEEQDEFARWPLRVIQWTFVLVYLSAGVSKLRDGGLDWFNGYTMSYYFIQDGLRNNIPLGLWLSDYVWIASLASILAVLFELTFAAAIFFPRLTWLYVTAGTLMHTTIFLVMRAPFFQYPVLYIAFIENLRKALPRRVRHQSAATRWTVLFDPA